MAPVHDEEVEQRMSGMIGLGNENFGKELKIQRDYKRLMEGDKGNNKK